MATEIRLSDLKAQGEHKVIFVKRTTVNIETINDEDIETIIATSRASYAPDVDVSSLEQEIIDLATTEWTSDVVSSYNTFMSNQPKNPVEL